MAPTHGRQIAVPIPGRRGESYLDVINRLRPILIELERQRKSVLLVTHLAVQRCLYSYFTGTDAEAIPYLPLPAGAVLELTPTPHGTQVRTHILLPDDEEALTRRTRPVASPRRPRARASAAGGACRRMPPWSSCGSPRSKVASPNTESHDRAAPVVPSGGTRCREEAIPCPPSPYRSNRSAASRACAARGP